MRALVGLVTLGLVTHSPDLSISASFNIRGLVCLGLNGSLAANTLTQSVAKLI